MRTIKNILQVTGSLKRGGLEKVAASYFFEVDKTVYKFVYVVFGDEIGELEHKIKKKGGKVVHIPAPQKGYSNYIDNLKKIMKEHGPFDVVHSHVLFNSGFVMKAAYEEGITNRVSHAHSSRKKKKVSLIKRLYNKYMQYYLAKYSTNFVACSQEAGCYLFGEENFLKHGQVIVNAIDVDNYTFDLVSRNKMRHKLNLENKLVIGHTGNFNKVKNHEFLLNILKAVLEKRKDTILLLVGDGPEKEHIINEASKHNLLNNIIFAGEKDSVRDFLMGMDVFVFPSLYEGLGLSLIEAQAANLPCLVSDRIPYEAIISQNTVTLSLEEDVSVWRKKVIELSTVQREENINFVENYRIEHMVQQINNLYN
ncbi:glycosyltransferase [Tetragenococcus halophilus]|uniref:glycosyltransferase n=1 Tax=Tetragenococcus halophilus TaxID=51669 RepID=UPI0030F35C17